MPRPTTNNADEWQIWLLDHVDSGAPYIAVQIAEALEEQQRALRQRSRDVEDALKFLNNAVRFVLSFYDPGQTYLDTNAWKLAEAEARAAHADASRILAMYTP